MFTASCSVEWTQGPNGELVCPGAVSVADQAAAPNLDPALIADAWGSGFVIASVPVLSALVLSVVVKSIRKL